MVLRGWLRPALIALAVGMGFSTPPATAMGVSTVAFAQGVAEAVSGSPATRPPATRPKTARIVEGWYRAHGYAPIWTGPRDKARLHALLSAFGAAADNGLPAARYDARTLRARLASARTAGDLGRIDVALTEAYLRFAGDLSTGVVVPNKVDSNIKRYPKRPKPDLLLNAARESTDFAGFLASLAPQMPQYARLMKAKIRLGEVIAGGGYGPTVPDGTLRPGDSGASVVALRNRLIALGYLARSVTTRYDSRIRAAVVHFQNEHGLNPDGIAGPATLAQVNTGAAARLKSVIVAMERLRWMRDTPLGARHVWVNLPSFRAQLIDDGAVSFATRAIIGRVNAKLGPLQLASLTTVDKQAEDTESPEFSDHIEYMDINPTWWVPHSIAVKEYLPQMQADPNADPQIDILDAAHNVIPRDQIDFAAYTEATFPYEMAQPPSAENALGLVKFIFPNRYNIYLHDTPTKSLFSLDTRAYSHGCIRLGDPFDFAYTLLSRQSGDPVRLFQSYLATGKEDHLTLNKKVPVHLVYFTAWPNADGGMDYYSDIYGRDAEVWAALRAAGVTAGIPKAPRVSG